MGPKSNDKSLMSNRRGDIDKKGEKADTDIGVIKPQAKKCLKPPETCKWKEGFSPGAFRGSMAQPALVASVEPPQSTDGSEI